MIGLELHWARCADGVALAETEYGEEGVRFRSADVRLYHHQAGDLRASMLEQFLRCESTDNILQFVSEFGLPGPGGFFADGKLSGPMDAKEQSIRSILSVRDGFRQLMGHAGKELTYEAGRDFNAIAIQWPESLTPAFNLWRNTTAPRLTFLARNPNALMLMEAALALSNATALQTCNHCSLPFLAGPLTSKRLGAAYCSNRCRVAAQRAMAKKIETRKSKRGGRNVRT